MYAVISSPSCPLSPLPNEQASKNARRRSISIDIMCREVSCKGCGNSTFAGCGMHIDSVRTLAWTMGADSCLGGGGVMKGRVEGAGGS
jgi:hypothetical protein